jgi:cytochrome P450
MLLFRSCIAFFVRNSSDSTTVLWIDRFFGTDHAGQMYAHRFKELIFELFTLSGAVIVGDFLPWLRWTTHVSGSVRHFKKVKANMDAFLQEFLDVKKNGAKMDTARGEDLVDILLATPDESGNGNLDDDAIKGVIQDMLLAGTDTSSNTVEWAIAELLRHPHVMNKLQAELDAVVGTERIVTETDIPNLPYLQVSDSFVSIFATFHRLKRNLDAFSC